MYFKPSKKKDKKIIIKLLKNSNIRYKTTKQGAFLSNFNLKKEFSFLFKDILPTMKPIYTLVLVALIVSVLSFYIIGLEMNLKSLTCENKQLVEKNTQLNCNIDDVNSVILELDLEAKNQLGIIQDQKNQLDKVENSLTNISDEKDALLYEILNMINDLPIFNNLVSRSGNLYQATTQIQEAKLIIQNTLGDDYDIDEVIKKLDNENDRILDYTRRYPDYQPVSGILTSRFGYRRDPFTGETRYHAGIDIAAPTGTNIYSCAYGVVVEVSYNSSSGNYITINHGNGYQTHYKHLSKTLVSVGQTVSKGERIGLVGFTGRSTGSHLHLEYYLNGVLINPLDYVFYG